jgi:hypothetical protein
MRDAGRCPAWDWRDWFLLLDFAEQGKEHGLAGRCAVLLMEGTEERPASLFRTDIRRGDGRCPPQ